MNVGSNRGDKILVSDNNIDIKADAFVSSRVSRVSRVGNDRLASLEGLPKDTCAYVAALDFMSGIRSIEDVPQ